MIQIGDSYIKMFNHSAWSNAGVFKFITVKYSLHQSGKTILH